MLVRPSSKTPPTWGGVPLARRRILLGIAAVGGFLAVDIGAVAYAGGWIGTAHRLTPHIFIKAFEWVNGKQSGFRKNHAKGVAVRTASAASPHRPGRPSSTRDNRFAIESCALRAVMSGTPDSARGGTSHEHSTSEQRHSDGQPQASPTRVRRHRRGCGARLRRRSTGHPIHRLGPNSVEDTRTFLSRGHRMGDQPTASRVQAVLARRQPTTDWLLLSTVQT